MTRDSDATRARILEAVGKLLAKAGFGKIGVNTVARAAGVDKVLIYRYFGGLPELLRAYARQGRFWPTIGELVGRDLEQNLRLPAAELAARLLAGHLRALRRRPRTQEIMRWELQQHNELTEELARAREQQGLEIMGLLPLEPREARRLDVAAMAAVLHAGITYLILRSKTADVYLGLDLRSETGWKRVEAAARTITGAVLGGGRPAAAARGSRLSPSGDNAPARRRTCSRSRRSAH